MPLDGMRLIVDDRECHQLHSSIREPLRTAGQKRKSTATIKMTQSGQSKTAVCESCERTRRRSARCVSETVSASSHRSRFDPRELLLQAQERLLEKMIGAGGCRNGGEQGGYGSDRPIDRSMCGWHTENLDKH